jgi:hypothetical protein
VRSATQEKKGDFIMAYVSLRIEKIKESAAFKGRQNHNDRTLPEGKNKNIDQSRTHLNITLQKPLIKNASKYLESKKTELAEFKKKRPECKNRNLKTGSNFSFETVIQGGQVNELPTEKQIEFLKHSFEEHKKKFKDLEVLSAYIHLDEEAPHLHIVTSFFNTKEKQWSQKIHFGEARALNKIQDWAGEIGKPFGLERGVDKTITNAKHQSHLHPNQVDKMKEKAKDNYTKKITDEVDKALGPKLFENSPSQGDNGFILKREDESGAPFFEVRSGDGESLGQTGSLKKAHEIAGIETQNETGVAFLVKQFLESQFPKIFGKKKENISQDLVR